MTLAYSAGIAICYVEKYLGVISRGIDFLFLDFIHKPFCKMIIKTSSQFSQVFFWLVKYFPEYLQEI